MKITPVMHKGLAVLTSSRRPLLAMQIFSSGQACRYCNFLKEQKLIRHCAYLYPPRGPARKLYVITDAGRELISVK